MSSAEEAKLAGYDPPPVLALIDVESDFEENAISPKGARGLMQLEPRTIEFLAERGRRRDAGDLPARVRPAECAHWTRARQPSSRIWSDFVLVCFVEADLHDGDLRCSNFDHCDFSGPVLDGCDL